MTDTDNKGEEKNKAEEPEGAPTQDEAPEDESSSEDKTPQKKGEKNLAEGRVKPPEDMDATAILPTKRTGFGESFFKTITYLSRISKDKTLTYRVSDRTTSNLL